MLTRRLFIVETKKYLRQLPLLIALSILLLGFLGLAFFTTIKILYPTSNLIEAKVAVVSDDADNYYIDFAMEMLGNMESTSGYLKFIPMDVTSAQKALNNGDVIAIMIMPPGVIDSILNGTNTPIQLIFKNKSDLMSVLFYEIASAGTSLLSSAQAGTYATAEIYVMAGATSELNTAFERVDLVNFSYVLTREDLFKTTPVSFGGTNNVFLFYIVSAFVLVAIISGCAYAGCFAQNTNAFCMQLSSNGITTYKYFNIQALAFSTFNFVTYFILLLLSKLLIGILNYDFTNWFQITITPSSILILLLISIFLSEYAILLANLPADTSISVLLFFITGCILVFLSGCIIPLAFLPGFIRLLADYLPISSMQMLWIGIFDGSISNFSDLSVYKNQIITLILYCLIFYILTMIIYRKKSKL